MKQSIVANAELLMTSAHACSTIFFLNYPDDFSEIASAYEELATPANGYLTRLNSEAVLVDAAATETANWARQRELAVGLSDNGLLALSIFVVGEVWAISLARDGQQGATAAFTPEESDHMDALPHRLLEMERQLKDFFPDAVDEQAVDGLFGAMLEGAICPDEGITALLHLLGCTGDWLRWSWYETIPEQLFLDPDLADRVQPLGDARSFWEE